MPPKKRRATVSKRPSPKRPKPAQASAPKRRNGAEAGIAPSDLVAVVGIGASAGGLRALEAFFDVMPGDSGLAFLVVQHLDPPHRSEIARLLSRHTGMPVMMAEDGVPIRPNHVYTSPRNRYLGVEDGRLSLTVPTNSRGPKFSIDSLFYSLGRGFGEKSAGVVLSGTGTDGTQGLRTIKGYGGLAIAQDPATAEFDAMPRSAIEAGVVDTVATIANVPEALIAYFTVPSGRTSRDPGRFPAYVSDEVEQLNDDVNNLLISTDIPIIFLDRQLRIRRFTPSSTRLFHLIPTDTGRPLEDIAPSVNDPGLLGDAGSVLDQLAVAEQQVSGAEGRVFVRQIRPYCTGDHRIGGVTITYQDITDRARAEERTEEAKRYAETIVETVQAPLAVVDEALVVRSVNPAFCHDFGTSPTRAIGTPLFAAMGGWSAPALEHRLGTLFQSPGEVQGVQIQYEGLSGLPQLMQVSARLIPLRERALLLVAFRNVTAQVEADRLRRDVLLRMVDVEEKERHRLALEIHDETGQQVTAFLLGLEALRSTCGTDERSLEIIAHLETRARELARDLVGVTLQLRPTALDAQGIEGALRDFADSIRQDSSLEVDFVATGWERGRLTAQTESALYRVAQEAIVNVLKHAHARRLSIVLERRADAATLAIEDDGHGFDPDAVADSPANGHSGVAGMRERLHLVGGSLTIESSQGQGTTVLARVPLSTNPIGP